MRHSLATISILSACVSRTHAYPDGPKRPAPSIRQVGILRHLNSAQDSVRQALSDYRFHLDTLVNLPTPDTEGTFRKAAVDSRIKLLAAEKEMVCLLHDGIDNCNLESLNISSTVLATFDDDLNRALAIKEEKGLEAEVEATDGEIVEAAKMMPGGLTMKNLREAFKLLTRA